MRCVNTVSVPGEASVAFTTDGTATLTAGTTGNITATNSADNTISFTGTAGVTTDGDAVILTMADQTDLTNGSQSNSSDSHVYWILSPSAGKFKLASSYANYIAGTAVTITVNTTGSYVSIDMNQPNHFSPTESLAPFYMIDVIGRAWSLSATKWVFMGNTTRANANGNGIGVYRNYLFVFRNALVDYMNISTKAWSYGWAAVTLNTASGVNNPHQPFLNTTADTFYFPDAAFVGSIALKGAGPFDPTNATTYTASASSLLLPYNEVAQCVSILGTNLLVGGQFNVVYSWDRTSTGYVPIYVAEQGIYKIITINTNAFLFAGNRGRIYICNGSQAQLFKKIPDHISGTVEPYFTWGDVATNRNQIYFGIKSTSNADTSTILTAYGGVWAIDIDTVALRLVQKLSYNTYNGFCTALLALTSKSAGFSLYMGWISGTSTYGVDQGSTNLYTGGQSVVYSDLIPVGTAFRPKTFNQFEYKLSRPLVSGESVQLLAASDISNYFTDISSGTGFTNIGTDSTVGNLSNAFASTVQKNQWLMVKAVLTGTNTSPSFVRLREIRIR